MNNKQKIENLWNEFRKVINQSYTDYPTSALKDYTENQSMVDGLARLLGKEAANERQHRKWGRSPRDFSVDSAAKLILMHSAVFGAEKIEMPKATIFLELRQTAAEAMVIGWLVRHGLSAKWRQQVQEIDYAKLMSV